MRNIKKKTVKKPVRIKHPHQLSETELRRKYSKWMNNFVFGIEEIVKLPVNTQMYMWSCVLQHSLYNQTTNSFFNQMFKCDLYPEYKDDMNDNDLSPLNKKRLENSLEELITTGCRKKFVGVLNRIEKSYLKGEY